MSKDHDDTSAHPLPVRLVTDTIGHLAGWLGHQLGLGEWDLDGAFDDIFWQEAPLPDGEPLAQALYLLQRTNRLFVFSGSGLSAESGIATFRGAEDGLYSSEAFVRMTRAETFETHPTEQLTWHQQWRDAIAATNPHAGHRSLVEIATRPDVDACITTQNVDRHIEVAADALNVSPDILHLHGELERVRCHDCDVRFPSPEFDFLANRTCWRCGGRLRPDVVWFGETPPEQIMQTARRAARMADVALIIGTSGVVYPAAALPEIAKRSGARLLEINPEETPLSKMCDVVVRGRAAHILPRLAAGLRDADASASR